MQVGGDELIIKSLFLKDSSTSSATVVLFLISSTIFFLSLFLWRVFHIILTFLGHLHRIFVHHLTLHSSMCLIKHLPWLSMNGSGWDYIVQRSSPHKCGQESWSSAFNTVVAAFPLDISIFLSPPYMAEVYPYRWSLLEGYLSHLGACSTDIRPVLLGLQPSTLSYAIIYSGAFSVIYSSSDVSTLANRA